MPASAEIIHKTPGRVRLRFAAHKGDEPFFTRLEKALLNEEAVSHVRVVPSIGSVLLTGEDVTDDLVVELAEKTGLFLLETLEEADKRPVIQDVREVFTSCDKGVKAVSGGTLDIASLLFFGLLAGGAVQLLRGRTGLPSWHTAFWYAFGLMGACMGAQAGAKEHDLL